MGVVGYLGELVSGVGSIRPAGVGVWRGWRVEGGTLDG